ncbi:MAG: acetate--CoA ligase family protein [Candidatus Anstonellaceae archaeon]
MSASDFELLSKYKIPLPRYAIAAPSEKLDVLAKKVGFPLAMKVLSPQATHKTEKGGVALEVSSIREAEETRIKLLKKYEGLEVEGLLLQQMVGGKDSVELIVGGKKDAQFGQMIMLGFGGIFVEVFKDVSFRICPIEKEDAKEMIRELRAYPILAGARGRKPINEGKLISVLLKVSDLLVNEDPKELDINPLIVSWQGCMAVDVRIMR